MSKKYNLVVLDGFTMNPGDLSWQPLNDLGNAVIHDRTAKDKIVERCRNAHIALTNKVVFDSETINNLPHLKYIAVTATGYNVVDIAAATKKGILVSNVPAYSADSVAQMVFAYILNLNQNVAYYDQAVHKGRWLKSKDFCFWDKPLLELFGKTLGLVGFGKIGRKVSEIANAFNMKVIVNTRTIPGNHPDVEFVETKVLFTMSDFISLHCPLTDETSLLINKKTLKLMKKSAVVINTGRGGLINEDDLADALNKNQISAACLDVLSTEPPTENNPLLTAKNCYITPHIAWATISSRQRLMDTVINNIRSFIDGQPQNIVNQ
jgi:glycerate dehydrogenase